MSDWDDIMQEAKDRGITPSQVVDEMIAEANKVVRKTYPGVMVRIEKEFAVSLLFEKLVKIDDEKVVVREHLITDTCIALNHYEALGRAIWTHNMTPDNGRLKLWQVAEFGSDLLENQVMDVFRDTTPGKGGKIRAIKKYREMTGTSLKEAKAIVDEWQAKYQIDHSGNPLRKSDLTGKRPCHESLHHVSSEPCDDDLYHP